MTRTAQKLAPLTTAKEMPDKQGMFGEYGGRYVSETLIEPLDELEQAYSHYRNDPEFIAEFDADLAHYVGRPSPLYHAQRLSEKYAGAQIYLKREDLNLSLIHI